jgi:hypothetical protein
VLLSVDIISSIQTVPMKTSPMETSPMETSPMETSPIETSQTEGDNGLLLHLPLNWVAPTINKGVNSNQKQNPQRKRKRQKNSDTSLDVDADPSTTKASCKQRTTSVTKVSDVMDNIEATADQELPYSADNETIQDSTAYSDLSTNFYREQKKAVQRNGEITGNANIAYTSASEKIHDIYAAIVKVPQNGNSVRPLDKQTSVHPRDCIELESIVANVPFLETMQSMFSTDDTQSKKYTVPIITKDYEEMYMRESFLTEDVDCIMGVNCECMFVDAQMPFVGTRFWSEQFIDRSNSDTPVSNKMCVLCCRKNTQQLFYDLIFSGVRFHGFIQLYGNICSVPNEYAKEAVLICPPNGPVACMPFPVVAHQRNRYSVIVKNGVKYIKQHNVYFEDFRMPSSST